MDGRDFSFLAETDRETHDPFDQISGSDQLKPNSSGMKLRNEAKNGLIGADQTEEGIDFKNYQALRKILRFREIHLIEDPIAELALSHSFLGRVRRSLRCSCGLPPLQSPGRPQHHPEIAGIGPGSRSCRGKDVGSSVEARGDVLSDVEGLNWPA